MNTPPPPPTPSAATTRPPWKRILIWLGIAFLVLNLLPLLFYALGQTLGNPLVRFVIVLGILAALSVPLGGHNLLRTALNPATARFTRHDDAARGGYRYEVRPARASWLAVLVPLPLCALLALWGAAAAWMLYVAIGLYLLVAGIFVLPGARHRKPVTIAVSPQGIRSGDLNLPLERIADLDVSYQGVKLSEDPLIAGPGGVPTSTLVGRGLGRRQAARSFALTLRADGQSQGHVLVGGLTQECAHHLLRDLEQAIARFGGAQPAAR